jgi:hypothetical protein
MRIELLYFEGCPSYEELLPRLRSLLERQGIDDPIELRHIETLEAAEAERFLGSPTVRIDGEDIDPEAATRFDFGLKCRLYRNDDGARTGTPTDAMVVGALRRSVHGPQG